MSGTRRQKRGRLASLTVARVSEASGPECAVFSGTKGVRPLQAPRAETGLRKTVQVSLACWR